MCARRSAESNMIIQEDLSTCPPLVYSREARFLEWSRRALSRVRQQLADEHVKTRYGPQSSISVEELFVFDTHVLRHGLGIDDESFSMALSSLDVFCPPGGKSKARFALSNDGEYIVKSLNRQEDEFLRISSPQIFQYYAQALLGERPSILIPLVGIFCVKRASTKSQTTLIIMPNIRKAPGFALFDLKGVGKRKRPRDPNRLAVRSSTVLSVEHQAVGLDVLWDMDFRDWCGSTTIKVEPDSLRYLKSAIQNDSTFLSGLKVIDYSLFTVVNDQVSSLDPLITVAIIDFLRPFTWDKKLESVVKTVNTNLAQLGNLFSGADDSSEDKFDMEVAPTVIRPELYARRFERNIISLFESISP
jgi:hypothetical protein